VEQGDFARSRNFIHGSAASPAVTSGSKSRITCPDGFLKNYKEVSPLPTHMR
jgi:hypothetical protein